MRTFTYLALIVISLCAVNAAQCVGISSGSITSTWGGVASWTVNCNTQTINMTYGVPSVCRGWLGVGWNNASAMNGADVVFAWYTSIRTYIYDYKNGNHVVGSVDAQQDLTNTVITQNSTWTSLSFRKSLNTGDTAGDLALIPGSSYYLLFACSVSTPQNDDWKSAGPHFSSSGNPLYTLQPVDFFAGTSTTGTRTTTTTTTATAAGSSTTTPALPASFVYDTKAINNAVPSVDAVNNVEQAQVTQTSAGTTLSFRKKLVTGDADGDLALVPGNTTYYLLLASYPADPAGDDITRAVGHFVNGVKTAQASKADLFAANGTTCPSGALLNKTVSTFFGVTIQYSVDCSGGYLYVNLKSNNTGWLACGFNKAPSMGGGDIVIGWLRDSSQTTTGSTSTSSGGAASGTTGSATGTSTTSPTTSQTPSSVSTTGVAVTGSAARSAPVAVAFVAVAAALIMF